MKQAFVILVLLAIASIAATTFDGGGKPNTGKRPAATRTATATATQNALPTATTQPTERPEVTYYTAAWEACLTVAVEQGNQHPNTYCIGVVNQLVSVNAYANRHSDMWQPLPASIVIP